MIGQYLETLTTEQEDRVLTERLAEAGNYIRPDGCRCLIGVTNDAFRLADESWTRFRSPDTDEDRRAFVGIQFDNLCRRFGEARVNAAIRNRILANQAHRVLADVQETREAVAVS
jgi:hypothetical protein